MPALQREAEWAEEGLSGDLRQSVPQNGRIHLHIIEKGDDSHLAREPVYKPHVGPRFVVNRYISTHRKRA